MEANDLLKGGFDPYYCQVDLMRSFTFRNSKGSYCGIPIIAANMDTVGTFEMALALHQVKCAFILERLLTPEKESLI